jgi:hypothetical protein
VSRTPFTRTSTAGDAFAGLLATAISDTDSEITIHFTEGIGSWAGLGVAGGFWVKLDYDTPLEEEVWVPVGDYDWSQTDVTITIERSSDPTKRFAHGFQASVVPNISATAIDEANYAVVETVGQITSEGDLLYGDAPNSLTVLPIGSTNQYLISDGGKPYWGPGGLGPQGPQGVTGATGATGATGSRGQQGTTGPQGSNGADGATGAQGPQGRNGVDGVQGATGSQGLRGEKGNQGAQGFQGATGTTGSMGPQGYQGFQGTPGLQGFTGQTGPQGQRGATGAQGYQGATGTQGYQGPSGLQGASGDQGPQGYQGLQGSQGSQGYQGPNGDKYQTFSGTEITIALGEVTLWVSENLNYTTGQDIVIAHDVSNLMVGVVETYDRRSGKLVALITQITGSGEYDEWQVNLDGATGVQGYQGVQGADGLQGPQGYQGNDGSQGPQGLQGEIGTTGPSGIYISDDGVPPPDVNVTWLDETATGAEFMGPQGPQGAGFFGDSRLWLSVQDPTDIFMPNGTWLIMGQDTPHWRLSNVDGSAGSDISLDADGKTINIATTGTYMLRLAFQYTPYQGSNQVRFASGASAYGGNFSGWIAGNPDPLTIAVAGSPGAIQNGDYIGNYIWRIAAGGSFTIAIGTWGNSAPEQLDGIELEVVRIV